MPSHILFYSFHKFNRDLNINHFFKNLIPYFPSFSYIYLRIKISVLTNISILGIYGYMGDIGDIRNISNISVDIFT